MPDFPLSREVEQRLLLDAVHQALQRRAWLERGNLGRLDFQLFAGLGVAADARGALAHFKRAKANQREGVTFFESARDDVD